MRPAAFSRGLRRHLLPGALRSLEDVAQADDDAAAAAVGAPLVEEVPRVDAPIGDAEVARVGRVEEVGPDLQPLALADPRGLQDADVYVVYAVGAQDVAPRVADALPRSEAAEEYAPARPHDLFHAHVRERKVCVQVRSDGVADETRNARERARRVCAQERREGRAALEREERVQLPAAQQMAREALLILEEGQLVDEVARHAVRSVEA